MTKRGLIALAVASLLLALAATAWAAPDYQSWIGQDVIFLPGSPSQQASGYFGYSFVRRDAMADLAPYSDLVGKRATVQSIAQANGYSIPVAFRHEDGRTLYGRTFGGSLMSVVFASELENAQEYIGRTVWHRTTHGYKSVPNFDPLTGREHRVAVKNLEPLQVVKVELGPRAEKPLCFSLRRDNGETLLWLGSYSRINDSQERLLDPFTENWHLSDPIAQYPDWPEDAWDLIRNFEVAIGMTPEMVRMAWGEPKTITRSITQAGRSEHWHYGNRGSYDHLFANVLFQDGRVTAIYD